MRVAHWQAARVLVIGDIHGHPAVLLRLVELVQIRSCDVVVLLGDYVDRGPDSYGAIEVVKGLVATGGGNVIALRGNHEQMMLDALAGFDPAWYGKMEVMPTIASYRRANRDGFQLSASRKHVPFLRRLPFYAETPQFIFVHGGVRPDRPMLAQIPHEMVWRRLYKATPHYSGKIVVCGHTPSGDQRPVNLGHTIGVDTGIGYPGGRLTCLDLVSGRFWQADEQGHPFGGILAMPQRRPIRWAV